MRVRNHPANQYQALNVLSPYLAGFMIPGKPIGVMLFKVFSVSTLGQAMTYSGDLKVYFQYLIGSVILGSI
jgi:hypothetical protein